MATVTPTKKDRIKDFLARAAVADADHDFSGTRAGEAGSIFRKIFSGGYKEVGTPFNADGIEEEWDILNSMCKFFEGKLSSKEKTAKFKEVFLTGFDSKKEKNNFITFQRWAEDTKPYKVSSIFLATKDKQDNYTWFKSSEELFNLLSPTPGVMYFTVDACNVPFYDCLQKDDRGASNQKTAICLHTREGVNDAAGKKEFNTPSTKLVNITTKKDDADYNILYPSILTGQNDEYYNNLIDEECFYSVYKLILSSLGDNDSLTLSITNKDLSRQIQITKHEKDESHANAVSVLANKIYELVNNLKNNLSRMTYHSYLQQKRAGDWLQCLACTNPARFGLDKKTRIKLVTLDKICLAYALFAGIDVIFTYFDADKREYYLVKFYKEAEELTKEEILASEINSFSKPEDIAIYDASKTQTYSQIYDYYRGQWQANYETLKANFTIMNQKFQPTGRRFDAKNFQELAKLFLKASLSLGAFRAIATQLDGSAPHEFYKYIYKADNTINNEYIMANYNRLSDEFNKYRNDYLILKKAITAKNNRNTAISATNQINEYFRQLLRNNYEGSTADEERGRIVDKLVSDLVIFGNLFNPANGDKNGLGVFEFLNNTLEFDDKRAVVAKFESLISNIPEGKDAKSYEKFINVMKLVMNLEPPAPIQEIAANDDLAKVIISHDLNMNTTEINEATPPEELIIQERLAVNTQAINQGASEALIKARLEVDMLKKGLEDAQRKATEVLTRARSRAIQKNIAAAQAVYDNALREAQTILAQEQAPVEIFDETTEEAAQEADTSSAVEIYKYDPTTKRINSEKGMIKVSKKPQPSRIFDVSDFGSAIKILGFKKANENTSWISSWAQRLRARRPQTLSGGGDTSLPISFHNPHITFLFLLRELGFRLSYEDDKDNLLAYKKYINIIANLISNEETVIGSIFKLNPDLERDFTPLLKYVYYKGFEIYFLEKAEFDKKFPVPGYLSRDLALTIKKGYYKIEEEKDADKNYLLLKELKDGIIGSFFKDEAAETFIGKSLKLQSLLPYYIKALEDELNITYENTETALGNKLNLIEETPYRETVSVYGGRRNTRRNRIKKILKRRFRKSRAQRSRK
jgi:hypothetical protein